MSNNYLVSWVNMIGGINTQTFETFEEAMDKLEKFTLGQDVALYKKIPIERKYVVTVLNQSVGGVRNDKTVNCQSNLEVSAEQTPEGN